MLILEEYSYEPPTWVEKALATERKQTHESVNALDPIEGGLLPRFFEKCFLEKVFSNIPRELFPKIIAHDHAIIYYEATKISKKNKNIAQSSLSHRRKKLIRIICQLL